MNPNKKNLNSPRVIESLYLYAFDCVCYYSFLEYLSFPSPLILIPHVVTSWEHLRVLRQCGSHLLLLLKPPGVRHLDVAPLAGCCFVHDPLQSGFQLRVVCHVLWAGGSSGGGSGGGAVLASGSIGNELSRDLVQNFGLGFFSPQESQLPPAWRRLCHDGGLKG